MSCSGVVSSRALSERMTWYEQIAAYLVYIKKNVESTLCCTISENAWRQSGSGSLFSSDSNGAHDLRIQVEI
ncbi:MAG: hypothetical protein JWM11_3993 [Planctomycetaceae bacterium]|nr:hypothetical protein [Planctomycetaceae bacterium]